MRKLDLNHGMIQYDLPLRPNCIVTLRLPLDFNETDADRLITIIKTIALSQPEDREAR